MARSEFTEADRGPDGRLLVETPMGRVRRLRAELEEPAATPAEQPTTPAIRPQLPTSTARQLIGAALIIALMAGIAAYAFGSRVADPPATIAQPTAASIPTSAPAEPASAGATITAYAAPDGAALGPIPADTPLKFRHSEHAGWAGVAWQGKVVWVKADAPSDLPDLAPPTPAPPPLIIYVDPSPIPCDPSSNPRYTAQLDVAAGGKPIGIATGRSCDSQQDAQAKAEQIAAEMRAAVPTAVPPPATPSAIVPRPPMNRPKPMQPPVTHDSGQSPLEIALAAAGWQWLAGWLP